jgi:uncharacterized protein YegP (UPF0339 family)
MSGEAHFEIYPQRRVLPVEGGSPGEVAVQPTGEFGWRFRAANGRINGIGGEGFTRRPDAHRAIGDLLRDVGAAEPHPPIIDVEE